MVALNGHSEKSSSSYGAGRHWGVACERAGIFCTLIRLEVHTLGRQGSVRGLRLPWLRRFRPCSSMTLTVVPLKELFGSVWTAQTMRSTLTPSTPANCGMHWRATWARLVALT